MAERTWDRAGGDGDFENNANWGGANYPVSDDTINISNATAPTTNRPTMGLFNFNLTNAVSPTYTNWLDGAGIGTVTINCNGQTVTAGEATEIAVSFTLTDGTYNDGGFAHVVNGGIIRTGGTLTSSAGWQMGEDGDLSGTLDLALTVNQPVTAELTANTTISTLAGNGTITGAFLLIFSDNTDNFWTFTGSCSSAVRVSITIPTSTGGAITLASNAALSFFSNNDILTLDGDLNIGDGLLTVRGTLDNQTNTLDANDYNVTCGAIVLGLAGKPLRDGLLTMGSGIWTIASITVADTAADGNSIAFDTAEIRLSGTLDGDAGDVICTNTSAEVFGGIVAGVNISTGPDLIVYGSDDESSCTGNTNVELAPPVGSMAMSGGGA